MTVDDQLSGEAEEVTILIIGEGPSVQPVFEQLEELGVDVVSAAGGQANAAVTAVAPDLVVLMGDAAQGGGRAVLDKLAEQEATAVAPVAVVGRGPVSRGKFKHGTVAGFSEKLKAEKLAKRLIHLAREIPERDGSVSGEVTAECFEQLVDELSEERRSGMLEVETSEASEPKARVMLKSGEPISEKRKPFVERVKPLIEKSGKPAPFAFRQSAAGSDSIHPPPPEPSAEPGELVERRLVVVDADRKRAERLASALAARGATALVFGEVADLRIVRSLDPEVVLVDPADLESCCAEMMDAMRNDNRTRWAATLLAPRSDLWPGGAAEPRLDVVTEKVTALLKPATRLLERVRDWKRFDTRLEMLGTGRLLRLLCGAGRTLHVAVHHPRVKIDLEIDKGLICGAVGQAKGKEQPLLGSAALSALMVVGSGRVRIEARKSVELDNLKAPAEAALSLADAEQPPIAPSIRPGAQTDGAAATVKVPEAAPLPQAGPASEPQPATVPTPGGEAEPAPPLPGPPPLPRKATLLGMPQPMPFGPPAQAASAEPPSPAVELFADAGTATAAAPDPRVVPDAAPATPAMDSAEFLVEPNASLDVSISKGPPPLPAAGGVRAALRGLLSDLGARLAALRSRLPGPAALSDLGARLTALRSRLPGPAALSDLGARLTALRSRPRRPAMLAIAAAAFVLVAVPGIWFLSGDDDGNKSAAEAQDENELSRREERGAGTLSASGSAPAGSEVVAEAAAEPQPGAAASSEQAEPGAEHAMLDGEEIGDEAGDGTEDTEPSGAAIELSGPDEPPDRGISSEEDKERRIAAARALVRQASRYRRSNRLGMAEAYYIKALEVWPRYPRAVSGVVRVHLQRRDGDEALRWARKLVVMQPKRSNNQLLLGDAYKLRGYLIRAKRAWRRSAAYGNLTARQRLREVK